MLRGVTFTKFGQQMDLSNKSPGGRVKKILVTLSPRDHNPF